MRRITLWLLSTLSAIVLLFSYPTSRNADTATAAVAPTDANATTDAASSAATQDTTAAASSAQDATTQSSSEPPASSSSSSSTSSSTSKTSGSGATTYAGDAVMTRWGLVQVQITVANGKITKSDVLQIPWDNPRDQQINSYAVPILNQEAVTAQSASIDMISGATVTSVGYTQSLQSAIDQAHLA